jgi:predicted esterase
MQHLSVLVVHGTADTVLPVAFGRQIRDYFALLPLSLTYREYEMGHEVSQKVCGISKGGCKVSWTKAVALLGVEPWARAGSRWDPLQ